MLEPLTDNQDEFAPFVHNLISKIYYLICLMGVLDSLDGVKVNFKKLITFLIVECKNFLINWYRVQNEVI